MKIRQRLTIRLGAIFGIIFGVVAVAGCGWGGSKEAEAEIVRPVKMIEVAAVDERTYRFATVIRSSRSVDLAFPVAGVLVELNALEGTPVAEGQVLGQLDPRDFQNKVDQAQAAFDLAASDLQRFEQLAASGAVSTQALEQAQAQFVTSRTRLQEAQKMLADTRLLAPFDGVVARRMVEQFANLQPKQPVLRFQALRPLEGVIQIPETLMLYAANREQNGPLPMFLTFAGWPERQVPARLKEVSTEAAPGTQTYQVVVELDPPAGMNILPGMSATLTAVRSGAADGVVTVTVPPLAVVVDPARGNLVWVYDPQTQRVERRNVDVGQMRGNGIEISGGVFPGEFVVVAGLSELRDGMKVRPL